MIELCISTKATACRESDNGTDERLLASIDGLTSDEIFSDYIIDHDDRSLQNINIQGGQLKFAYDRILKELWTTVTYRVERYLSDLEIEALIKYTLGQLSDGIGENLVQDCAHMRNILIDPVVDPTGTKAEYLN